MKYGNTLYRDKCFIFYFFYNRCTEIYGIGLGLWFLNGTCVEFDEKTAPPTHTSKRGASGSSLHQKGGGGLYFVVAAINIHNPFIHSPLLSSFLLLPLSLLQIKDKSYN